MGMLWLPSIIAMLHTAGFDHDHRIYMCVYVCNYLIVLTLYDPGEGFKSNPPPIFWPHAFNFGATILYIGDFSQKLA